MTKIIGYFIAAGTVLSGIVYIGEVIKEVAVISKPGSDEERKALEKVEKIAYNLGKGTRDGIFWSWISHLWRKE